MKRPRKMMRGCCALAVVASTALGLEDHQHSLVRRVQGFGVGVVVETAPPVPPAPKGSSTVAPIAVSPITKNTTAPMAPAPTLRLSPAPSTLAPSLSVRDIETPRPTPASTGGGISLVDSIPASTPAPLPATTTPPTASNHTLASSLSPTLLPLLPYPLNFPLEFQIAIPAGTVLADATDKVETSLSNYLSTLDLSLDTEQTLGPMQVASIDSAVLGRYTKKSCKTSHFFCSHVHCIF